MFHLPREIIQLIFEFDPTYREEYNKVLRILKRFPAFQYYTPKRNYFYVTSIDSLFHVESLHPSKLCFQILRNSNSLYKSVIYRYNYNIVISHISKK
jgi:hypothetical protein